MTRKEVCKSVAKALREFGYPGATDKVIDEVLTAWIAGKREVDLPHGIIGRFAGRQFDDVENERPGFLAKIA